MQCCDKLQTLYQFVATLQNGLLGNQYKVLAPPYDLVLALKTKKINQEQFAQIYNDQVLSKLKPRNIYDYLIRTFGDDATLLCFEKPDDFCHRHLVSQWFRNNRVCCH